MPSVGRPRQPPAQQLVERGPLPRPRSTLGQNVPSGDGRPCRSDPGSGRASGTAPPRPEQPAVHTSRASSSGQSPSANPRVVPVQWVSSSGSTVPWYSQGTARPATSKAPMPATSGSASAPGRDGHRVGLDRRVAEELAAEGVGEGRHHPRRAEGAAPSSTAGRWRCWSRARRTSGRLLRPSPAGPAGPLGRAGRRRCSSPGSGSRRSLPNPRSRGRPSPECVRPRPAASAAPAARSRSRARSPHTRGRRRSGRSGSCRSLLRSPSLGRSRSTTMATPSSSLLAVTSSATALVAGRRCPSPRRARPTPASRGR